MFMRDEQYYIFDFVEFQDLRKTFRQYLTKNKRYIPKKLKELYYKLNLKSIPTLRLCMKRWNLCKKGKKKSEKNIFFCWF